MENLNMEQPNLQIENNVDVNEQIINEENATLDSNLQTGSMYGKFKDATSLLEAYNSLEKEFTKKSQKLAEALKQNNQQAILEKNEAPPIFKQNNWQTEVSKFFEKNPEAKKYSKEISEILIKDPELAKHSNCLEYAFALHQSKNQVNPANLLKDPKHVEDIMNNNEIKQKIITEYLQNVNNKKTNLKFISGVPNIVSPTRLDNKPKTIKEASNILKKLLQS